MLCSTCQETESSHPVADDGVDEAGDDAGGLCSRCGRLRTPDDLVKRARDKHSQLEGFGLAGRRGSLLDRRRKEDKGDK